MFAKPYKLKSNNTLKNSEKKQLIQRIKDEFPAVTDERIKELVPSKSAISCLKLVLSSGDTVGVFVSEGHPMLVDTAGGLVPTVCALWKVPEMVPTITIHALVLPKVQGGAPLYLPGVHLPAGGAGFPVFARGAVLAARTHDCAAAALVGRAAMGSGDMLLRAAGVCVEPAHVLGDQLCRDTRFARLDRPNALAATQAPRNTEDSLATNLNQLNIQPTLSKEEWPSLGRPAPAAPAAPPPAPNAPKLISAEPPPDSQSESAATEDLDDNQSTDDESEAIPEDMDGLLRWCLLTYLKLHSKTAELPIKTSLLYRNHLVPLCPGELALDVKKSSYKKMSKFLEAMQQAGLLEVHELERGVDAVTGLNALHPSVRAHRVPAHVRARAQRRDEGEEREYAPPVVREMLCVTAAVLDLLTVKKGTALTSGEVRQALTDYVKSRSLTSTEQRGAVRLDSLLAKITGKQEQSVLKWDALMLGVQSRMTAATEMRFADGTLRLTKTRLEPVTMKVATRSGNKKVTLVSNLESFGFVLSALSGACQRAVGASCGVTRAPGALADQLMLQGDQTHFVAKLLVEKYGLPKKFLEGADKALNKKK